MRAADHPAVRVLTEVGLLGPGAAASATVTDLSRAHGVWSVRAPGLAPVVVKQATPHGGPDLAVECLIYRITVWSPEVARALPRALLVDEDRQLLVLADAAADGEGSLAVRVGLPGPLAARMGPSGSAAGPGTAVDLVAVAGALGATVGALHRATAGLPLPPGRRPMILSALVDPGTATSLGPAVTGLVDRLRQDVTLVAAAADLAGARGTCLVHNDLKWDNVVPGPGGRTTLVDWELAGSGDPAWDLGSLLAEHLCRLEGAPRLDEASSALLRGYARAGRLRPGVAAVLARRSVQAAALRCAQMAVELVWTAPAGTADAVSEYLTATNATVRSEELAAGVAACLA